MIDIEGLKYFFSFVSDIPPRFATPAFSVRHLVILFFLISVYTFFTIVFKNKNGIIRSRYLRVLACLLVFFNIVNELWLYMTGHLSMMTELPLQLCGTMYIIIPFMVLSRSLILMEFVYACGMPGAFFAMLTPDTQGYYFVSFEFLVFNVIHSLIVYIPLFMLITGEFKPRIGHLYKVSSLFFSLVLIDLIVDHLLGSNYLYLLNPPEGTLLQLFASWVGSPGYIFIAILITVIVWITLYLPWELFYRLQRQEVWGME